VPDLRIAQDAAADELLGRDPLALLLGMMLDQHMRQRSSESCRREVGPDLLGSVTGQAPEVLDPRGPALFPATALAPRPGPARRPAHRAAGGWVDLDRARTGM
jgi:hypothetical protein